MKILVCITHVPDTTSKIQFTANNTKFDSHGLTFNYLIKKHMLDNMHSNYSNQTREFVKHK